MHREAWPRLLATLIRWTGGVELAEDALAEAFARAAALPPGERPDHPEAWLLTVARRVVVDAVRRDASLRRRLPVLGAHLVEAAGPGNPAAAGDGTPAGATGTGDDEDPALVAPGGDDRLGLLLLACHPDLPPADRLALSLRFVLGVPTADLADVLLVEHAALSARLTRAKRRLQRSGLRLAPPADAAERDARLPDLLDTVHLLYTTGHTAPSGTALGDAATRRAALELAAAVHRLWPDEAEIAGLRGVLLLTEARAGVRVLDGGDLVTLEHADRRRWDRALTTRGLVLAARGLEGGGRYGLLAGIAGLHTVAPSWERTDWDRVVLLYDGLLARWPSPAAALARLVALARTAAGPERALRDLDALEAAAPLAGAARRQALAVRGHLLASAGRGPQARAALLAAAAAERNAAVRAHLERTAAEV
ncbi:DUF6596 domain-containing protein [Cellulomonas endophytica]|uniref:DUF6596 domain-containing protein n=1 Tax=Cellulomonas endophytica TaxID=2494735 RepID=UPI0013E9475D|nr:DUF6596 domain-containing protein [Cellulomonas endophytica]